MVESYGKLKMEQYGVVDPCVFTDAYIRIRRFRH